MQTSLLVREDSIDRDEPEIIFTQFHRTNPLATYNSHDPRHAVRICGRSFSTQNRQLRLVFTFSILSLWSLLAIYHFRHWSMTGVAPTLGIIWCVVSGLLIIFILYCWLKIDVPASRGQVCADALCGSTGSRSLLQEILRTKNSAGEVQ